MTENETLNGKIQVPFCCPRQNDKNYKFCVNLSWQDFANLTFYLTTIIFSRNTFHFTCENP